MYQNQGTTGKDLRLREQYGTKEHMVAKYNQPVSGLMNLNPKNVWWYFLLSKGKGRAWSDIQCSNNQPPLLSCRCGVVGKKGNGGMWVYVLRSSTEYHLQ